MNGSGRTSDPTTAAVNHDSATTCDSLDRCIFLVSSSFALSRMDQIFLLIWIEPGRVSLSPQARSAFTELQ